MVGMFHAGVRPSLAAKGAAAAGLVALADLFFFRTQALGFTLGLFGLAVIVALVAVQPAIQRDRRAVLFLAGAAVMAAGLVERPTFVGWVVYVVLLGMAALSPRAGPADDAWRWFQRLAWQTLAGAFGPALDALKLMHRRIKRIRFAPFRLIGLLLLPALGGLVFLALFSAANPVIADLLGHIQRPRLDPGRVIFWGFVFVLMWGVLRPRFLRKPLATPGARGDRRMPGVSVASVTLSLIVFNLLFAVQNGLDLAFLWSGARLPEQFTLAEYVHAGVYPLMASAVATALFVLIALRPGSEITASKLVRLLVILWVAQNLFVVASSAYRLWLYVESFSLTRVRILVMIWMAMVAVGLVSILWRLLRDLGTGWLLDVNARTLLLVLTGLSVFDIGAVAAHWNVRHSAEKRGGQSLDLCYLDGLGTSAAVSIAELEQAAAPGSILQARVGKLRAGMAYELEHEVSDWRSWTWRAQRRLDRVRQLAGGAEAVTDYPEGGGYCDPTADTKYRREEAARATVTEAVTGPPPSPTATATATTARTSLDRPDRVEPDPAQRNTAKPSLTPEPQSR
jgi:hypothetical protein